MILKVKAGAYVIESANPRHEHEWSVWKDVKLPPGRVLIPGVISHATNVVEHPELIAERTVRFANQLGRENVMIGTDCGFAQGTFYRRVHPSIMWAKFEALVEGARLATKQLWSVRRYDALTHFVTVARQHCALPPPCGEGLGVGPSFLQRANKTPPRLLRFARRRPSPQGGGSVRHRLRKTAHRLAAMTRLITPPLAPYSAAWRLAPCGSRSRKCGRISCAIAVMLARAMSSGSVPNWVLVSEVLKPARS